MPAVGLVGAAVLADQRVLELEYLLFGQPGPVVPVQYVQVLGDLPQLLDRLRPKLVVPGQLVLRLVLLLVLLVLLLPRRRLLVLVLAVLPVAYLLHAAVPAASAAVLQRHERERAEHGVAQHYQAYARAGQHRRRWVTTAVSVDRKNKQKINNKKMPSRRIFS